MTRALLLTLITMGLLVGAARIFAAEPEDWQATLRQARGQTVYWYAWGGSNAVNDYIAWAAEQAESRYGVRVEHVKVADTGDAVSRVIAEKSAGRDQDGAVDLIWINGENFAAMKEQSLLYGLWTEQLPNWRHVDVEGKPVVTRDFTLPTDGFEAPWGLAKLVFLYDANRVDEPPRSIAALLDWARANPGRFAYPQPPDFLGTTFLKQALYELTPDPAVLQAPATAENYPPATAPLWRYLEALNPNLWRSGGAYPQSGTRLTQLLADAEVDIAISFNPNEAANAIANFTLPETVRTYVLEDGTIGNASFLAIPYNADAKAGAMVLTNFLLSPEAQAHKQDPEVWGNETVLALDELSTAQQAAFADLRTAPWALQAQAVESTLPEPHPSWTKRLEQDWVERFGSGR